MDEERAAHLDAVLIGGREPTEISVVDYDERWAVRFRGIAERLRRALGENALGVEHIGSTSVPGLAAKPIVDVLLTVADVDDETAYLPALEGRASCSGSASRRTGWCGRRTGTYMCTCTSRDDRRCRTTSICGTGCA